MVVEFVLGLAVWAVLVGGIVLMGRVVIAQQRAQRLARYGTLLQSTGRVTDVVVRQQLNEYALQIFGGKSTWEFKTGRFLGIPSASFYRLVRTEIKASVEGVPWPIAANVVCQQEAS